jgi:hypothetical protein
MDDYKKLVGLVAADKENKKLGKIIKIEILENSKTKIKKPHALILVKSFFRKDVVIVMDLNKLLKADSYYAWFDILKKDFNQEVKETRALMLLYE